MPINDCYLTGEHYVSTDYGNFNASEYYNLFSKSSSKLNKLIYTLILSIQLKFYLQN